MSIRAPDWTICSDGDSDAGSGAGSCRDQPSAVNSSVTDTSLHPLRPHRTGRSGRHQVGALEGEADDRAGADVGVGEGAVRLGDEEDGRRASMEAVFSIPCRSTGTRDLRPLLEAQPGVGVGVAAVGAVPRTWRPARRRASAARGRGPPGPPPRPSGSAGCAAWRAAGVAGASAVSISPIFCSRAAMVSRSSSSWAPRRRGRPCGPRA